MGTNANPKCTDIFKDFLSKYVQKFVPEYLLTKKYNKLLPRPSGLDKMFCPSDKMFFVHADGLGISQNIFVSEQYVLSFFPCRFSFPGYWRLAGGWPENYRIC